MPRVSTTRTSRSASRANPLDPTTCDAQGKNCKRRFSQFGSFRMWYGNGKAKYDGLNLSGRARLGQKFEMQGFYTLSHSTGNILAGADEFRLTDAGHQPDLRTVRDQSVDPYDPLCSACDGPLNTDARHRVTLSGLYKAPLGLDFSGIFRYRSGTPYTDWAGTDISCGPDRPNCKDGYAMDLPAGVSHVNSLRGGSFSQFDVRLSKTFNFYRNYGVDVIGEIFNLFNSKNPAAYIGNRASAAYRQPSVYAGDPGQGEQRLAQLGVRVHF